MTRQSERTTGLGLGLAVLALTSIAIAAVLVGTAGPPARPDPQPPVRVDTPAVLSEPAAAAYLRTLERTAPIAAERLRDALSTAGSEPEDVQRDILLLALLAQFRDRAGDLRTAPVASYDAILRHVGDGLENLSVAESRWCKASELEALLKNSPDDLVDTLLQAFRTDEAAYQWLLGLGQVQLEAVSAGYRTPVRHGPRTYADKLELQRRGLALGRTEWALALQIAAFSQAEGRGYEDMRTVIAGIDTCQMGIMLVELSGQLPVETRGRIWAELMPEIFYGNTPFVLYVVTDYFFLS